MNRYIEFIIALPGLIVLSPLFLIIAVWIKLDSKGPVFYHGERVGLNGRIFYMLKFRSMMADASVKGPPITTQQDSRVTRAGRFLRKTKLDELPQLINVLKGDMKFVGPRPEDPAIVKKYTPEQKQILNYRPGITSPASVMFRAEEEMIAPDQWESVYMNRILPRKLDTDLAYMKRAGFWSDAGVILKTVGIGKRRPKNKDQRLKNE